jgi:hypothetical protein
VFDVTAFDGPTILAMLMISMAIGLAVLFSTHGRDR